MKHECVRKYSSGYPTKEQTLNDPMLLKNMPERWKGIALCCSAMSLLTFTACAEVETTIRQVLQGTVQQQQIAGGITAPTYSLSEDEAVSIIADEYELNGVDIDIDTKFEVEAKMPVSINLRTDNYEYEYSELKSKLVVDGKVKDKNLCFEYISAEDFKSFTTDKNFDSFYGRMDFMSKYLETKDNQTIQTDKGELVKIFYEYGAYDKSEAEKVLRQQVREYIEQLKASGVI